MPKQFSDTTLVLKSGIEPPNKGGSPVSMHYGDIINMVVIGHNTGLTDANDVKSLQLAKE